MGTSVTLDIPTSCTLRLDLAAFQDAWLALFMHHSSQFLPRTFDVSRLIDRWMSSSSQHIENFHNNGSSVPVPVPIAPQSKGG